MNAASSTTCSATSSPNSPTPSVPRRCRSRCSSPPTARSSSRPAPLDADELRAKIADLLAVDGGRRMSLSFIRGHGRGGQPVRVHPAADLSDVLPRSAGRHAGHPARHDAPGGDRQRRGVGRVPLGVPRRRRRSPTTSRAGSTRTPSTRPGAIGVALLVLGVAMLFGYKLPFMTPTARRRRQRWTQADRQCDVRLRHRVRGGVDRVHDRAVHRHGLQHHQSRTASSPASATCSPTAPAWRCS